MSEKYKSLKIETGVFAIPGKESFNPVEIKTNGDWNDLIPFKKEAEYVSPEKISKESISRIKARKIGASILSAAA